jgi:hypothetical protein
MGKKKEPSVADAIKQFKEVTQRASLSDYYHVNGKMLSLNDANNMILVIPESKLWEELLNDTEIHVKEIDITEPDQFYLSQWFAYGEDLSDEWWIPIDINEELFTGKVFKIKLGGYDYKIPINRDSMPLKLKKAEYNNVSYRVFKKPGMVLAIKKYFGFPIEGYGFTIMRMFQIV